MGALVFAAAAALGLAIYKLPIVHGWSPAELHHSAHGPNVPLTPDVWGELVRTAGLARELLGSAPGCRVSSFYRSRETQLALYKSLKQPPPTYNPHETGKCCDVAGPADELELVAANARAQGVWKQVLWQVPLHFDHVHLGR